MKTQQEYAEDLKIGCMGCLNVETNWYNGTKIVTCSQYSTIEESLIENPLEPTCEYWDFLPNGEARDQIADHIENEQWERVGQ